MKSASSHWQSTHPLRSTEEAVDTVMFTMDTVTIQITVTYVEPVLVSTTCLGTSLLSQVQTPFQLEQQLTRSNGRSTLAMVTLTQATQLHLL